MANRIYRILCACRHPSLDAKRKFFEELFYPKNSQAMRKIQRSPIANIANPTNSEKRSAATLGYLSRQVSKVPSASIRSYCSLRSSTNSYFGSRPVNMTVSIGNFEGRKWVLKKWTVKIKPEANRASSECTIAAMFSTHPGRKRAKNSGSHSIRPESPMANIPQKTARKSNFSQ